MNITLNIHHHTRDDLYPYAQDLVERNRNSAQDFLDWIHDRELFESFTSEAYAIRYNAYSSDTRTPSVKEHLDAYEKEIHPKLQELSDQLNRKCVASPWFDQLPDDYKQRAKCIAMDIKLFRSENIPLFTQDQELSHQYSKIKSEQTIEYDGRTLTLQQAADYLKNNDRNIRKEVFEKICTARAKDADAVDQIMDQLITLRTQIAHHAGYANYRDYMFDAKHRFDYTAADCERFHRAVAQVIKPAYEKILEKRKSQMSLEKLMPYDMEVDPLGRDPLPKFPDVETMIQKTSECLNAIDPEFGTLLLRLKSEGNLDLGSREGKGPGGYCVDLSQSKTSFVFSNGIGDFSDFLTLVHEMGHCTHNDKMYALPKFQQNNPSELAEIASMSMEYFSLSHIKEYTSEEIHRAKEDKLIQFFGTLSRVATIDAFQHRIYLNPNHSHELRNKQRVQIYKTYMPSNLERSSNEKDLMIYRQKQIHVFSYPFYYIEYAISELGALGMYKQYLDDSTNTLKKYKAFLSTGYTKPIPDTYALAGLRFDFGPEAIQQLSDFALSQME